MRKAYGVDSMPETAENVANDYGINRADQDAFAWRSQMRTKAAADRGFFAGEILPVTIPRGKGDAVIVDSDEHPRPDTTLDMLAKLKPIVRDGGTVTAGNASGVNDGAAALIVASDAAVRRHGLTPRALDSGLRHRRRRAADHGDRPGSGDAQADGANRPRARRFRRRGTQRSLCRAGAGSAAPARAFRTTRSTSIRMAAPSRSAIRWAHRARVWR